MNHKISLTTAVEMTTRYRENKETILAANYKESDVLANCETFEKNSVLGVLQQTNASFLRVYYGMDAELKVHAILVAADENGADILPSSNASLTEEDPGTILEDAQRCPPYCPPASALNGE